MVRGTLVAGTIALWLANGGNTISFAHHYHDRGPTLKLLGRQKEPNHLG